MKSYPGSDAWWLRHTVLVTLQYKKFVGHIAYWHYSNMCGLDALKLDIDDLCDAEFVANLVENDCEFYYDEADELFSFELHSIDGSTEAEFDVDIEELGNYIVALEIIDAEEYVPKTGKVSK